MNFDWLLKSKCSRCGERYVSDRFQRICEKCRDLAMFACYGGEDASSLISFRDDGKIGVEEYVKMRDNIIVRCTAEVTAREKKRINHLRSKWLG